MQWVVAVCMASHMCTLVNALIGTRKHHQRMCHLRRLRVVSAPRQSPVRVASRAPRTVRYHVAHALRAAPVSVQQLLHCRSCSLGFCHVHSIRTLRCMVILSRPHRHKLDQPQVPSTTASDIDPILVTTVVDPVRREQFPRSRGDQPWNEQQL